MHKPARAKGPGGKITKSGVEGKSGAGWVTRTPDPIITNDVLYQLS